MPRIRIPCAYLSGNLDTGYHYLPDDAVVEVEYILDEFTFVWFDRAALFTFSDDKLKLIFRVYLLFANGLYAKSLKDHIGKTVEQPNKGSENVIEDAEWN
jgi:hypothetical protein